MSTAVQPHTRVDCWKCQGTGLMPREMDLHLANVSPKEPCSNCGAGGKVPLDPAHVEEKSN